ncbi:MAG: hypothetical protein ACM3SO_16760 [Betaproteobacteria bacterium]
MRHRYLTLAILALGPVVAFGATSPAGNKPQPPADTGFFRPSADPNLTAPRPNERPRPTEALTAEDKVQAGQENVGSDRAPDPVKVMRWTEQQMDRSEHEAAKAKPAPGTPAPINGAFTGQTDERNR